MHSAHLGLDCLTPESPFGKKVTVPVTTMSGMMDERTMKEAVTEGLAVAPVGFLITSLWLSSPWPNDLQRPWAGAVCARLLLPQPRTGAKLLFSLKLESSLLWARSSPCIKAERTHPRSPPPRLSYQDIAAASTVTPRTAPAGVRQTSLPDPAS